MMKRFRKYLCIFIGHSFYSVVLNNHDRGGSSFFGTYICQRCGHTEDWQYDL